MKLCRILIAGLVGLIIGAEVNAAVVTVSHSQTRGISNFTTVPRTFNFNLIDTAFGQSVALSDIVSISITASLNKSAGSWSVEDISESEQFVTVTQSTKAWFTSLKPIGIDGSELNPALDSPFSLVVGIPAFGMETGDFNTFSTGQFGGSLASADFSEFLGAGTFDIVLNGAQSFLVTGGAVNQNSTPPRISGSVVVTYEIVPEPSAASLIVFSAGALLALRRRRGV